MPRSPRRPDPEPLQTNDVVIAWIGVALWVVAFAVLALFFRADLRRHHATWWLWSCAAGVGIGIWGAWLISRRSRG